MPSQKAAFAFIRFAGKVLLSTVAWLMAIVMMIGLFASYPVFGTTLPAVFTPETQEAQQLDSRLEMLGDPKGAFDIDQVATGRAGRFVPMVDGNFGYDYPNKAIWIRFTVDTRDYPEPHWFLLERWEHVGKLSLFYPDKTAQSTFTALTLTEEVPARERPFNVHQYLFKVPTAVGPTTYYMRYEPNGHTLNISLTWAGMKGLVEHIHDAQLWLGLFFGGMIIMWLYNLMLLWYLRDRAYFYYIYYLGGFIVTFAYMNGFAPIAVKMGWWHERLFAMAGYAAMHGVILFARHFLLLKDATPRLDKTLKVCQWLVVVGVVAIFVLQGLNPYYILNYLIFLLVPLLIVAGFIRWHQGYAPAGLYCLGWIVFAISLGLIGFKFVGLLPANFVTNYAIQLSSAWETVVFAFALAYRIKLMEQESKEKSSRFVKELTASVEKEKQAVKDKTAFISAISHELRNPLQHLTGAIEILTIQDKTPTIAPFIATIQRAAEQITAQMRDIGDYSKLEAGVLEVREKAFMLGDLLADVVDDFTPQAEAKGITLHLQNPNSDQDLVADADRLRQILNNLMSNAIKFTDHGSVTITETLEARPAGQWELVLSVTDTGPGIADQDLPKLFKLFSQLDSPHKSLGTGLGLSIVKGIVALLKGEINVYSEVGVGTKMQISIPVKRIL